MNKLKKLSCLALAVLCMAGFSVTAYASDSDDVTTSTGDTAADTENTASDETGEDIEYTVGEDGNLSISIEGLDEIVQITTTGTVTTGDSRLNLRTGAGMDYEIIDQLNPGDEVTVIGSDGDWYEVIVPEKRGYVYSDYLDVTEGNGQSIEIDSAVLTQLLEALGLELTGEDDESSLAFTPEGNLTLIDDFLQVEAIATEDSEQIEKQFITVQSKNGNTFYLVIDRNGDTENVYFMNLVDEAYLMALMEDENGETEASTCSCSDKCIVGDVDTSCEICAYNMSECTGKEAVSETEVTEPVEEPEEENETNNFLSLIVLVLAGGIGGAVYWFKFRKPKTKTSGSSDLDDYDFGEDAEDGDEETELDDADVMAEAESEEDEA